MSALISMEELYRKLKQKSISTINSINNKTNSGDSKSNNDSVFKHNLNVLIDLCNEQLNIFDENNEAIISPSYNTEYTDNNSGKTKTPQKYQNPGDFIKEINTVNGIQYKCNFTANCAKLYKHRQSCFDHIHMHTGEKPYKCDYTDCGFSSRLQTCLRTHLTEIHTKTWRFKCDVENCDFKSNIKSRLVDHIKNHVCIEGYKYKRLNNKSYNQTDNHKKRHHISYKTTTVLHQKKFHCSWKGCEYKCAIKYHLLRHRRTHTGEKPFKCDHSDCDYAAARTDHLKRHKNRYHFKS